MGFADFANLDPNIKIQLARNRDNRTILVGFDDYLKNWREKEYIKYQKRKNRRS